MKIEELNYSYASVELESMVGDVNCEVNDFVFAKLVNTESNLDLLAGIPHRPMLDLSLIYYLFEDNDPDKEEILLTKEMLYRMNTDEEELFDEAMLNTRNIMGESIRPIIDVIRDMMRNISLEIDCYDGNDRLPMYVFTNLWKRNGAICMLYDDALQELSDFLDSDLFVIPSSVHEVVLVPAENGVSRKELDSMICHVNSSELNPEDILSDHAYYYSRQLQHLIM